MAKLDVCHIVNAWYMLNDKCLGGVEFDKRSGKVRHLAGAYGGPEIRILDLLLPSLVCTKHIISFTLSFLHSHSEYYFLF